MTAAGGPLIGRQAGPRYRGSLGSDTARTPKTGMEGRSVSAADGGGVP